MHRISNLSIGLAFALAAVPHAVVAQAVVQPLPGTTDADRLGDQMRRLATNPQDVDALVTAGELSLGLGDLSGAASLFARAERVDPRNGRVKAGMASILVRSERPGEALRYFAQAEAFGLPSRRFAADRGLAYDLIGEQERAQRDYRVALKEDGANDETIRRYALSLAISGKEQQALDVLDPLLRRTDRAAWRTRAFVLALNGHGAEASRIATTMLPAGMAQGLGAFFERLPTLPVKDRAFAVHFGEVHSSPERLADARMAPVLAALAPDPIAASPVVLAAVAAPVTSRAKSQVRSQVRKARPGRVAIAQVEPTPVPAAALPLPPVEVAQASPITPRHAQPANVPVVNVPQVPVPIRIAATPRATPLPVQQTAALGPRPGFSAMAPTGATTPSSAVIQPVPVVLSVAAVAPPPAPPPRTSVARASEDTILARIIAGISIPAEELGVAPPPRAVAAVMPVDDGAVRAVAEANAKIARDEAARRIVAEKLAVAKTAADRKAADRKAAADKKALADKKAAAEAKALAAKEAAEEKKAARANPPRIWVQVAGGAREGDLPKAYAAVKGKAPDAFSGRGGWSTPLRATNRVLTGPFKTDAEARAFVNQLAKAGISAFSFTSSAGQPVTKLAGK